MVDTRVQYSNLAGTILYKQDGNLAPQTAVAGPTVLIIGTSGKGPSKSAYTVNSTAQAKSTFGTDGTLIRGMWEAKAMGAEQILLYRIGALPAIVAGIGNSAGPLNGGYIVETIEQDADAGENYSLYYDDSEDRLVVKRNSDDLIVYDNDPTTPIDRYEVLVSGYRASGGGPDIGSPSSYVDLEDIDVSYAGTQYTPGGDGLSLSRMEMFQELYNAYEDIKQGSTFDVVVPMDVYLDDYNVCNQGHFMGAVTPEVESPYVYPTAGRYRPGLDVDSLGKVYVEEYEGRNYFWWWFNDGTGTFTAADIYPGQIYTYPVTDASHKIDGTALTADDFHEVNFAYQLGRFLYEYSTNIVDATGVISALPPVSNSLTDRARWIGRAPTLTYDNANDVYYIANASDNGNGLLGNKFMAGFANYRSGVLGGGFIATEDKFMDSGDEIIDDNDIPVDLGKYFSIVVDFPLLRNNSNTVAYPAAFAASYAGFYVTMSPKSAPTNKKVSNVSLLYKVGLPQLDALAGAGYVVLRQKPTGLVIADAPTASMPDSDWSRLSTVRIVKEVVDQIRSAVDPFLGEGISSGTKAALKNAVENVLMAAKKAGYLQDFRPFEVYQTAQMQVQGKATIELTLVPAFELRQVTVNISLSRAA